MPVILRHGKWADLANETKRKMMLDCLRGLGALHEAGFAHRDIKPGNILVDPAGLLCLTDFDASCFLSGKGALSNTCGPLSTTHFCRSMYMHANIGGARAGVDFSSIMCTLICYALHIVICLLWAFF